jgi:hypothetical protein
VKGHNEAYVFSKEVSLKFKQTGSLPCGAGKNGRLAPTRAAQASNVCVKTTKAVGSGDAVRRG